MTFKNACALKEFQIAPPKARYKLVSFAHIHKMFEYSQEHAQHETFWRCWEDGFASGAGQQKKSETISPFTRCLILPWAIWTEPRSNWLGWKAAFLYKPMSTTNVPTADWVAMVLRCTRHVVAQ